MTTTIQTHQITEPTFVITEEIQVHAPMETTFDSLLAQMGQLNESPDGKAMPMVIEPRPGGRWYRELGGNDGHLWGFVQSIRRPSLLELWGPMFLSTGATSNMLYRLSERDGITTIVFTHTLVGPVPEPVRANTHAGWSSLHARVKRAAEALAGARR
mgnify:CR=1 FL=1